ncbi:hypothetical protein, partial [uncultured Marinobacter sp.]|uniref:hypothetical protein n=1 Tax=uncultured Marinobacter sp. TaxID=187379 RepID=UPI0030DBDD54
IAGLGCLSKCCNTVRDKRIRFRIPILSIDGMTAFSHCESSLDLYGTYISQNTEIWRPHRTVIGLA